MSATLTSDEERALYDAYRFADDAVRLADVAQRIADRAFAEGQAAAVKEMREAAHLGLSNGYLTIAGADFLEARADDLEES